jgi:tetratricopeptide (TPR) repeat protein
MARATFKRAVHVSHVNNGPHNLGQLVVLESMAEIYLAVGEHEEALDVQERMFSIQARKLEPFSLELIPALQKQARWQHRLQMYDRERVSWRRIIDVLERHFGKNDLRLIPPLTNLGKSYLFVTPAEFDMQPEISVASGETYLRRANRIAENNPDTQWQILEQTLLALGDYYLLSGRANRASRSYKILWALLSEETLLPEDEARLGNRREHLEKLNVLQATYPPKYYRSEEINKEFPNEEDFETGTVSYGFTVNSSGRVVNVMHIETQPPEFEDMSARVRRNLRRLVYRPRLEDGIMVKTPNMTFTHEFFYRPGDIPSKPSEEQTTSR